MQTICLLFNRSFFRVDCKFISDILSGYTKYAPFRPLEEGIENECFVARKEIQTSIEYINLKTNRLLNHVEHCKLEVIVIAIAGAVGR